MLSNSLHIKYIPGDEILMGHVVLDARLTWSQDRSRFHLRGQSGGQFKVTHFSRGKTKTSDRCYWLWLVTERSISKMVLRMIPGCCNLRKGPIKSVHIRTCGTYLLKFFSSKHSGWLGLMGSQLMTWVQSWKLQVASSRLPSVNWVPNSQWAQCRALHN